MTRVTTWEGVEYLVVTKVFCNIALIFKYWSDYDGAITVKKEEGGPKQRITSITTKKDLHIRTYTNAEVMDEFGRK